MPLTREALARTRPDHRPRLTPIGEARATVLSLCDGARTIAELEAAVLERHPQLFTGPGDAAAFVVDVLGRTAR